MVKYRVHGPKHRGVTEGRVYELTPDGDGFNFVDDVGDERWTSLPASIHCERFELISEGPVRTVMRQEIIPGTYDGVKVGERMSNEVWVGLSGCMDHAAIIRAAAVLTALAGALRDDR